MEISFSSLCGQERSCYTLLREHTDACAALGLSYEFGQCRLPAGCIPERAALGFWRRDSGVYIIYFKPAVEYRGADAALAEFFKACPRRFSDFPSLAGFLRGLKLPRETPELPLPGLEEALKARVYGQDSAVECLAMLLRSRLCGPDAPLSILLHGPSGVGKTTLGLALAPALNQVLGTRAYSCLHSELTDKTRAQEILDTVAPSPRSVLLWDGLDAARPETLSALALTVTQKKFSRCVFLFTARRHLFPELEGRLTAEVGFSPMGLEDRAAVTARQSMALGREYGLNIVSVSPQMARYLACKCGPDAHSAPAVLESLLRPVLSARTPLPGDTPVYLGGDPGRPVLLPA